jgi:murein L,D-transpeptidase YcbB/YkuD
LKYILLTILFINSTFALSLDTNTTNITDTNTSTVIDYHSHIKNYFTKRKAIGANIQKGLLRTYYKKWKYEPIWFEEDGKLNPISNELIRFAKNDKVISDKSKKFYNLKRIDELVNKYQNESLTIKETLQLDFLLTNLYDNFINNMSKGSINWKEFKEYLEELHEEDDIVANWEKYRAKINKYKLLKNTLESDDINISINSANYSYPNANKLYAKLLEYEEVQKNGGYVKVPTVRKSLRVGMKSKVVPILKKRLIQSNDYIVEDTNSTIASDSNKTIKTPSNIYTKKLSNAVKNFQRNHGLYVDGICGKDTIRHLNISVQSKIAQIKVNLERMRWMKRDLGDEYLIVNIPDFNLKYYNNNKEVLKLSVIVGTKKHPTPIFSHRLSTVVLNPYWRVPERIAQREIVPKLLKNPNYLDNKDMNIHPDWNIKSETIAPTDINWTQFAQNEEQKEKKIYPELPYRFIQIPGDKNPLGKMKFLFRNKYMVYIHDTNTKHFFKRRKRAFSHGCIRLHNPHKLLATIEEKEKALDPKKDKEILEGVEQTEFSLRKKIPIHIIYLTAWVDDNNNIQFRDDIYGYDKVQRKILY